MGTDTLNNDSCPTRIVGADRIRPLAKCIGTGWLNGICSGFYHPSGKSDGFGGRRPSSGNIVGSEEPPILPASPRGKPRGANQSRLPFIQLLAKIRGYGRMISAPTGCGEAFGFRHVPYRVYPRLPARIPGVCVTRKASAFPTPAAAFQHRCRNSSPPAGANPRGDCHGRSCSTPAPGCPGF